MPTFDSLGIDFPLFAADVSEAGSWSPGGTCYFCHEERSGFEVGIGDYVLMSCPSCSATTYASADGRDEPCHQCGGQVALPSNVESEHGCWKCLRGGVWAATRDTEAGMVTPDDGLVERTQGLPFAPVSGVERFGLPVGPPNDDGWCTVSIPANVLTELVRSPRYVTWQGETWLFHCGDAMRYLGLWGKRDFIRAAKDSQPAELARAAVGIEADSYAELADVAAESHVCVYMFECRSCGAFRGYWDCD